MSGKHKLKDYEVEAIKDKRQVKEDFEYLVKWKGYERETWEPIDNLLNCLDLVRTFETSIMNARNAEKRKTRSSGRSPSPKQKSTKPRSSSRGRPRKEVEETHALKPKIKRTSRSRSRSNSPSRKSARSKAGSVITNASYSPKSDLTFNSKDTTSIRGSPKSTVSTTTHVGSVKRLPPAKKSPIKDAVSNLLRFRKTAGDTKTTAGATPPRNAMSFDDMASQLKQSLFLSEVRLPEKQTKALNTSDNLEGVESSKFRVDLPPNGTAFDKARKPLALSPRSSKRKPAWWEVFDRKFFTALVIGILLMALIGLLYLKRDQIYLHCENFVLHAQAQFKVIQEAMNEKLNLTTPKGKTANFESASPKIDSPPT